MQGKKVSTLVFMALESSPCECKPRAVEMCLVAVQRDHFVEGGTNKVPNPEPRCLNKLRLCFNPQSVISFASREVTGFSNDDLKDQQAFNEDSANLLKLFLKRLPPPVCLLAHNGNGVDFRLLQAELKAVTCVLSDEILCADTYTAFMAIMEDIMPNTSLIRCKRNNLSSPFDGNNGNNCPKAINLTMNKGFQPSCIQSTSQNNCCIMFNRSDLLSCSLQNMVRKPFANEDEVEVITIKDQKPETSSTGMLKENGDTAPEEFPVIDLTEDSSVDGSSDDDEEEDGGEDDEEEGEEGGADSDDSNIIIENENRDVSDVQSTSDSNTKELTSSENNVETDKPVDSQVKTENVDTETPSGSELNGNVVKNIPKKRIHEDEENEDDENEKSPPNKKIASESNNLENKDGGDDDDDNDEKVSSTVLTVTNSSTEATVVNVTSTEVADQSKPKHNISSLHKLLLGHVPNASHSAEGNVNALIRIFQVAITKLCNWIDLNAVSLNQTEPLW